jgi:hypothetical protein
MASFIISPAGSCDGITIKLFDLLKNCYPQLSSMLQAEPLSTCSLVTKSLKAPSTYFLDPVHHTNECAIARAAAEMG